MPGVDSLTAIGVVSGQGTSGQGTGGSHNSVLVILFFVVFVLVGAWVLWSKTRKK